MKQIVLSIFIFGALMGGRASALQSNSSAHRALFAYLRVLPGTEQQFLNAAQDVIRASRAESGNLVYNMHQSVKDPEQFLIYELFRSEEALQFHKNSKPVLDFLKAVNPILVPGQFILDEYEVKELE
jgi:quinol monooxygenase YgiN